MTLEGSLELPATQTEFRAERLGSALRGLAAELIDERRKVAALRREIALLTVQLASLASAPPDDEIVSGGAGPSSADLGPNERGGAVNAPVSCPDTGTPEQRIGSGTGAMT